MNWTFDVPELVLPPGFFTVISRLVILFGLCAMLILLVEVRSRLGAIKGNEKSRHSLWPRFRTWAAAAFLGLAAVSLGSWGVTVLAMLLAWFAGRELTAVFDAPPETRFLALAPIIGAALAGGEGALFALGGALMLMPAFAWRRPISAEDLRAVTGGCAIILWLGAGLACLVLISRAPNAFALTCWVLLVIALNDVMAMFGGLFAGRHTLLPAISPSKTVEGFLFGALGAVAASLLLLDALPSVPPASLMTATLGLILAGNFGDLTASWVKRAATIKDYGTALPGHGGVMDRIDSLLFGAPTALALHHLGVI